MNRDTLLFGGASGIAGSLGAHSDAIAAVNGWLGILAQVVAICLPVAAFILQAKQKKTDNEKS